MCIRDSHVTLTVRDTGCGIPAGDLPHVTEPFYMVDKSRARDQGGSGMGLALCARIAELHGTRLELESRPGAGTRVHLTPVSYTHLQMLNTPQALTLSICLLRRCNAQKWADAHFASPYRA